MNLIGTRAYNSTKLFEQDFPTFAKSWDFEHLTALQLSQIYTKYGHYSYFAAVVYILTIFGLQNFMKHRKAFDIKPALFVWNTVLGIFSIIGLARNLPEFLFVLNGQNGFHNSVCQTVDNTVVIYWWHLFTLSKIFEFGDTLFIVLRKKPLLFVQWYHHVATMFVAWTVAALAEPIFRWIITMNFFVHAIMYPYFSLKTIGVKVPRLFATTLTTVQFLQMVFGLGVNLYTAYIQTTTNTCVRSTYSIAVFIGLYSSFVLLFGNLLWNVTLKSGKRKVKSE